MKTLIRSDYGHIAVIQMNRIGSNLINTHMVLELKDMFSALQEENDVCAVILTGKEDVFSAGLDLEELHSSSHDEFERFWWNFASLQERLVVFPKPLAVAITGDCLSAACAIALCADYRILAEGGSHVIGFNDVAIGQIIPETSVALLVSVVGSSKASQLILDAAVLHARQAQDIGLVHEICPKDVLLDRALFKLERWLELDTQAWRTTKFCIRQPLCEVFAQDFRKVYGEIIRQWLEHEVPVGT